MVLDAFAGYNQQLTTSVLLGVEAEIGFTPHARRASVGIPGANGLFPIFGPPPVDPGNDFVSVNTPWSGSVRGRVGYLVRPDSMVYATLGVAFQRLEYSAACFADPLTWCTLPHNSSQSSNEYGWTVGGGIEHSIASNWLVRLDYRASFFGDRAVSLFPGAGSVGPTFDDRVNATTNLNTQQITIGLSYKF